MYHYKHHLGDYARDTAGLTQGEHGSYRLLMDAAYSTEQGIPDDEIYTISKATNPTERRNTDKVLRKYWTLRDGRYFQKRIEEEIAEYRVKSAKAAESAKERWRHANADANADAKADAKADADAMPAANQQPVAINQQQRQRQRAHDASPESRQGGRRLLISDWHPNPDDVEKIAREVRSDLAVGAVYRKFYEHHVQLGSVKLPKTWIVAWREWCEREHGDNGAKKRKHNSNGSNPDAHTGESREAFEARMRTTRKPSGGEA